MLAPLKVGKFSVIFLVLLPSVALMLIFLYQDYASTMKKVHEATYKNFLFTTEKQFYNLVEHIKKDHAHTYNIPEVQQHIKSTLSLFISDTLQSIMMIENKNGNFETMVSIAVDPALRDANNFKSELLQSYNLQQLYVFNKGAKDYFIVPIVKDKQVELFFLIQTHHETVKQIEDIINPLNEMSFKVTLLLITLLIIGYIRLFFLHRKRDESFLDPVTQVFNRRYYHEVMKNLDPNLYQILLLRIDDYKSMKNRYDEEITDIILQSVANRILRIIRRQDVFIRFEGATFIIFYKQKRDEKADILAARIIESISKQPIIAEGLYINIDIQIAINSHPEENNTLQEAIEEAQKELQKIEKNSFRSSELGDFNSSKKSRTIFELQEALKENRVTPMFQPIYDAHTMKIARYELFARITSPHTELIKAIRFIELISNDPIGIELDISMLRQAITLIKEHHITLHLNLHVNTLCHESMQATINSGLKNDPTIASYLCIEINGLYQNNTFTKEMIKEQIDYLKALNITVILDNLDIEAIDFKDIIYLGPDMLKLDYVTINNDTYKLIQLSKKMNMQVVVKTIQNEEELLYAQKSNADFLQGYFLDEPDFNIKEN